MSDEEMVTNPIWLIGVQGIELECWFPIKSLVCEVRVMLFLCLYSYRKTMQSSLDK